MTITDYEHRRDPATGRFVDDDDPGERRFCRGCQQWLPLNAFYRRSGEDGYRPRCKRCMYAAKGHQPRQPAMSYEEMRARNQDAVMRCRYSIDVAEYERMLAAQGGVCADCGSEPNGQRLHIDHDHECCPDPARSCGRCIRGLVCFPCNLARG